jgi:hypothetical protein
MNRKLFEDDEAEEVPLGNKIILLPLLSRL